MDQKVHSLPAVERFWLARLRIGTMIDEHEDWKDWVVTSDLYDQYVEDARHHGVRFKGDCGEFMRRTLDIFPGAQQHRRLCERLRGRSAGKHGRWNGYCFPSRHACQLILADYLGVDPDDLFGRRSRSAAGQQASPAKVIPITRAGARAVGSDDDDAPIAFSADDEENVQVDG